MDKKTLHLLTYSLVVVGALNWGLWGLFNFNLVNTLLGAWPNLERLVYVLVGASAVYDFAGHSKYCKYCGEKKPE
ncbi:DUF378 domain-containing protein [Candidatus Roizmanbacteria bacterium]|nr:DUF378 domain-containing protein [Candidatus Roizmanbacteria bacterium]